MRCYGGYGIDVLQRIRCHQKQQHTGAAQQRPDYSVMTLRYKAADHDNREGKADRQPGIS